MTASISPTHLPKKEYVAGAYSVEVKALKAPCILLENMFFYKISNIDIRDTEQDRKLAPLASLHTSRPRLLGLHR